jgi:hypothetical protein
MTATPARSSTRTGSRTHGRSPGKRGRPRQKRISSSPTAAMTTTSTALLVLACSILCWRRLTHGERPSKWARPLRSRAGRARPRAVARAQSSSSPVSSQAATGQSSNGGCVRATNRRFIPTRARMSRLCPRGGRSLRTSVTRRSRWKPGPTRRSQRTCRMPPRRCNATRRAAAAVAQQRGRRLRSSGRGNAVRRRRTGPAAVTAPPAIDASVIRIVAGDRSRCPGRARHMGPSAPGRRAPSPGRTQVPRREQRRRRRSDPWRGPRASTARQASPGSRGVQARHRPSSAWGDA